MDGEGWYGYIKTWPSGRQQPLAQLMTATQAEQIGAVPLEDFEAAHAGAKILRLSFRREGLHEASFDSVLAEVPGGGE